MPIDMSESSRSRDQAASAMSRTPAENDALVLGLLYIGDALREGFVELGKLLERSSDELVSTVRHAR